MLTEKDYAKIKSTAWSLCSSSWSCIACPRDTDKDESMCHTRRQLKDLYIEGMQAGRDAALKDILKRLFAFAGSNDYAEELHEFIVGEDKAPYPVRYIAIDTLRKLIKKEFGVEL